MDCLIYTPVFAGKECPDIYFGLKRSKKVNGCVGVCVQSVQSVQRSVSVSCQ